MLDFAVLSIGATEIIAGVGDTLDGVGDFVNVDCAWFAYHAPNIPEEPGRSQGQRKRFWLQIAAGFAEKSFSNKKLCQKPASNSGLGAASPTWTISKVDSSGSRGDVVDFAVCRRAAEGVDYVFHQAAIPSVPRSVREPLASHESGPTATINMFEAARLAGVRRFLFAASSSDYGDTTELPKHEDMLPRPLNPYAAGKLAGEY